MLELLQIFIDEYTTREYLSTLLIIGGMFISLLYWVDKELKAETSSIIEKHINTKESIESYNEEINSKLNYSPSFYKLLLSDILGFLTKKLVVERSGNKHNANKG